MCDSCWAFFTKGTVEGSSFVSRGKPPSLSKQQLEDCGYNGGLMATPSSGIRSTTACAGKGTTTTRLKELVLLQVLKAMFFQDDTSQSN
ncbi:putative cysteine protease [Phytophthora cinnamomi]|uniref:putative cysteine protease n=1 Tax=Phytophthora cinnamomi TaxID=4785 RepID=UPI00355A5333|nr:putative cysteine protease [Phytophthora cinnamomi]